MQVLKPHLTERDGQYMKRKNLLVQAKHESTSFILHLKQEIGCHMAIVSSKEHTIPKEQALGTKEDIIVHRNVISMKRRISVTCKWREVIKVDQGLTTYEWIVLALINWRHITMDAKLVVSFPSYLMEKIECEVAITKV